MACRIVLQLLSRAIIWFECELWCYYRSVLRSLSNSEAGYDNGITRRIKNPKRKKTKDSSRSRMKHITVDRQAERRTERQDDGWTDRQTDGQTDRFLSILVNPSLKITLVAWRWNANDVPIPICESLFNVWTIHRICEWNAVAGKVYYAHVNFWEGFLGPDGSDSWKNITLQVVEWYYKKIIYLCLLW